MVTLGKLESVQIREVWALEPTHFTPWLARPENLKQLADELSLDLELQSVEKNVGPFRADIVCKNLASDGYVIIENQFGKTDHDHLGQIITYASGLKATTVVWIAEKFVEEHRAALDWLNNFAGDNVDFFGIEIELYKIGDSVPAPMFNVVSKPNNWSKTMKRKVENPNFSDTKLLQQEYWQELKDYIEKENASFKMQKPLPQHWTTISIGRTDFKICAIANTRDKFLCVQLVVSGPNGLENFRKLRDLYEAEARSNLSEKLQWAEKDGKEHHVNFLIPDTDPFDRKDWSNQLPALKNWIEKFIEFFKDKIRSL